MKSWLLRAAVIQIVTMALALCASLAVELDDGDLLRAVKANPRERDLADGLLQLGPAEMRKQYDPDGTRNHFRLDAWLSRGSLDTKLAAGRSPKTLLAYLEESGIHHNDCVAGEYWMLGQFSHVYRDQLRLQNERSFPRAGALARSIRDALNAVNDHIDVMCGDRSYASDMIWGQSEWLLQQAKPRFVSSGAGHAGKSGLLLATLRSQLLNCRDREGLLASENLQKGHEEDHNQLESCLQKIHQALTPWNSAGRRLSANGTHPAGTRPRLLSVWRCRDAASGHLDPYPPGTDASG